LKVLEYKNASVARTNIYGLNWLPKESVAEWILNALINKNQLTLFKDVYFTPILTNDLADVLMKMVENRLTGLFHVAGSESITKLDFGYKLASIYGLKTDGVKPILITDMNFKAQRPMNPSLNCSKIQKTLKIKLNNVTEGLLHFKQLETGEYKNNLKKF
jgi:dTDP-4-dehydrorhamnose reductase